MENHLFESLATLRSVIGFLGEQAQYGWWSSAFFSSSSRAFLNPVFPRTPNLARYTGVTHAAARVHDERIGVGRVYHLFRLPEDMEQWMHKFVQDNTLWQEITPLLSSKEAALAYLRDVADTSSYFDGGPIRLGALQNLKESSSGAALASCYLYGFEKEEPIYPYFAGVVS
jgi:hypothetical protein